MTIQKQPDSATLVDIYRRTSLIKQNDERFRSVIKSGKLVMPYYSPRGQEVIPSALSVHLSDDDYICTIYRGIHDMLAKGVPTRLLWSELAGKATGTCKGKGGPMHVTHPESGVMVTTGIVGSSLPIANGLALAAQIRGESRVAIAYFGDGAANQGQVYESFNMAQLWKLPAIYIIENNQYAMGTSIERSSSTTELYQRGASFGIPGEQVDGMDVLAVRDATARAVKRAREGGGPFILEVKTYRYRGHSMSDPAKYRTKEEVDEVKKTRDPIDHLKMLLAAAKAIKDAGEEFGIVDFGMRALLSMRLEPSVNWSAHGWLELSCNMPVLGLGRQCSHP